jgi:hypothetical protein
MFVTHLTVNEPHLIAFGYLTLIIYSFFNILSAQTCFHLLSPPLGFVLMINLMVQVLLNS